MIKFRKKVVGTMQNCGKIMEVVDVNDALAYLWKISLFTSQKNLFLSKMDSQDKLPMRTLIFTPTNIFSLLTL